MDMVQGDFMYFIADIFAGEVQYGRRTDLCDMIITQDFQADQIQSLANFAK